MTIYALSTAPGVSGIAIIRLSGNNSVKIAKDIIHSPVDKPRMALLKTFYDSKKEIIDEGIVIWYPKGQSYTGDDLVEFHVHGSKAVINKFLDELSLRSDCQLAEPGEFTKQAFLNNKINLYEAESIADLLNAETEGQRVQALRLKNSSPLFMKWRERILDVMSKCEAAIDFSEEDLPPSILDGNDRKIKEVVDEIDAMLDDSKVGEIMRGGFKIAIFGPPNSGKSSFLNLLAKRKAAIVSEIKGTTRDIIEVQLQIKNFPVILSDTAGIRTTKNKVEKIGISLALKQIKNSNLNILILDGTVKKISMEINKLINEKTLVIINKQDKKSFIGRSVIKNLKQKNILAVHEVSTLSKFGYKNLIENLENILNVLYENQSDTLISRTRHRTLLIKTSKHLKNYLKISQSQDIEKVAEELRIASNYLGEIVGLIGVEELLGRIFQDFCVGK
jgi:tRNA modification GTPase